MSWWRLSLCVWLLAAGCAAKDNPRYCGDGVCSDPAYPFCDINGTLGGLMMECIAPSCTAGEFAECRGDVELRCSATGDGYDETVCPQGCNAGLGCPGDTYQLVAIHPEVATTGDEITLEGTFGPDVTIQFPGGTSVAGTGGPHRVTAIVPEVASSGALSVTTGGITIGGVPFRRASFELGMQTFRAPHEQAHGTRQAPILSVARTGHSTAVIGSYLYVFGGASNGAPVTSIERAAIHGDGSLGLFAPVSASLVAARERHVSVVIGSFVYVLGGLSGTGVLNTLERAPIHADGSLGAFATFAESTLVAPRAAHASAVIGNWLYVLGGTGSAALSSVERAPIRADGALGPFAAVAGVTLTHARASHGAIVVGSALYVLGGSGSSGPLRSIERAALQPDGSIGPFAVVVGSELATAREQHATIALGKFVYVVGGLGSSGPLRTIERAPILADDALGAFVLANEVALAATRAGHASAVVENFIYVLGGSGSGAPKSIERASIQATGALGTFARAPEVSFVAARTGHTTAIIGNSLYAIGGGYTLTSIEQAPIRADGSLGPFATVSGSELVDARGGHSSVVVGSYVYVLGGGNSTVVERAAIQPDGKLGPFATVPGIGLVTPRIGQTAVVIGSWLYVVGGVDAREVTSTPLSSIERAVIQPDGSLGPFSVVSSALVRARSGHASVVIGDALFVIGGNATAGSIDILRNVERAAIQSDGTLGSFAVVPGVELVTPRHRYAAVLLGNALYAIGGQGAAMPLASVERATVNPDGSIGPFSTAPGIVLSGARAGHTSAGIGNSLYVLGGSDSAPSRTVESAQLR